jgi:hypothetical protein
MKHRQHYKKWSPQEDAFLKENITCASRKLTTQLDRSCQAIQCRKYGLKLQLRNQAGKLINDGWSFHDVAKETGLHLQDVRDINTYNNAFIVQVVIEPLADGHYFKNEDAILNAMDLHYEYDGLSDDEKEIFDEIECSQVA